MNFSSPIKYTSTFKFSPNNKHFALVKSSEIHIYNSITLDFYQSFSFSDTVSCLEWSADSNLILISFYKPSLCEVKSIDSPDWLCRIDEGAAGLSFCRWSPDSRRVITICDFNLRLTIWSLVDKSTCFINSPKHNDKGLCFTSNNYFMALLERKEGKDYIGLYYISDWSLVSHFQIESVDAQDMIVSKDDAVLVVWDSVLECKLLIYSPSGNLISIHSAYDLQLGIRNCVFNSQGTYLSVGYYDENIRLFSNITWKVVSELEHRHVISDPSTYIFKEEEMTVKSVTGEESLQGKYSIIDHRPYKLPFIKPQLDKANPLIGIIDIRFSHDSTYLASKNEAIPNVIYIWNMNSLSLYSIVIHIRPVKSFTWSTTEHLLSVLCENDKVYMISLNGAYICSIPTDEGLGLGLNRFEWSDDGKGFLVGDRSYMFVGRLSMESN